MANECPGDVLAKKYVACRDRGGARKYTEQDAKRFDLGFHEPWFSEEDRAGARELFESCFDEDGALRADLDPEELRYLPGPDPHPATLAFDPDYRKVLVVD